MTRSVTLSEAQGLHSPAKRAESVQAIKEDDLSLDTTGQQAWSIRQAFPPPPLFPSPLHKRATRSTMSTDTCPQQANPFQCPEPPSRVAQTNASILSAVRECGALTGDTQDESVPIRVELARDALSLYYDEEVNALHVLLDGTVVLSGLTAEQLVPVGVISVADLQDCYPNSMKRLKRFVYLNLSTLTQDERSYLASSLMSRQGAEVALTPVKFHEANADFVLRQGWTHALTDTRSHYYTRGPAFIMQRDDFSDPDTNSAYHLIDTGEREDRRADGWIDQPVPAALRITRIKPCWKPECNNRAHASVVDGSA